MHIEQLESEELRQTENADCECDVNGLNKETNIQTQEAHYSHGIIGSDALSHCLFITQCMLMSPLVIAV